MNKLLSFLVVSFVFVSAASAQDVSEQQAYNDCAAIFFNGSMLVDNYSPDGKCVLNSNRKGELTLYTVSLTDRGNTKVLGLPFRVAIQNDRTGTYWLHTKETVKSILLEDLILECEEGDRLVVITDDKKYALPHGVVELDWKEK